MYLNETLHPDAEKLAAAINAYDADTVEDSVYVVLENQVSHLGDEAKADLYARLAEAGLADVSRSYRTTLVSKALWQNQREYPRG